MYTQKVKSILKNIHTCILNLPLQSFRQDNDLASYTTYLVCVNIINEWRVLHFKVGFEQ